MFEIAGGIVLAVVGLTVGLWVLGGIFHLLAEADKGFWLSCGTFVGCCILLAVLLLVANGCGQSIGSWQRELLPGATSGLERQSTRREMLRDCGASGYFDPCGPLSPASL